MFKNFATSSAGINLPSSIVISPSSTPTASSPQDDVAGDDDSSTSSIHTPVSFSSGAPDSPVFYRQSTIEVPVLDALSAHKTTPSTATTTTTQLHPPTILLEIPSNGINNKCLSPIREMPTPIPSPALTPIMPRPQRMRSPQNMHEESMSVTFSGDYSGYNVSLSPVPIVSVLPLSNFLLSTSEHKPQPSHNRNQPSRIGHRFTHPNQSVLPE